MLKDPDNVEIKRINVLHEGHGHYKITENVNFPTILTKRSFPFSHTSPEFEIEGSTASPSHETKIHLRIGGYAVTCMEGNLNEGMHIGVDLEKIRGRIHVFLVNKMDVCFDSCMIVGDIERKHERVKLVSLIHIPKEPACEKPEKFESEKFDS